MTLDDYRAAFVSGYAKGLEAMSLAVLRIMKAQDEGAERTDAIRSEREACFDSAAVEGMMLDAYAGHLAASQGVAPEGEA